MRSLLMLCAGLALPLSPASSGAGEKAKGDLVYQGKPIQEWLKALNELKREKDKFDYREQDRIIEALVFMGHKAPAQVVPLLVAQVVESKNREAAEGALRAIERLGPRAKDAVPALIGRLDQTDKEKDGIGPYSIRYALARIGKPAVPALVKALASTKIEVKRHVIGTLGEMKPPEPGVVGDLVPLLKDRDLRLDVLQALQNFGPDAKAAVAQLADLLDESAKDKYIAQRAAQVLREIGQEARASAPQLRKLLVDTDAPLRLSAAAALWRMGEGKMLAVAVVSEALDDKNDTVRREAASVAGQFEEAARDLVPKLRGLLKDKNYTVRERAVQSLGEFGPAANAAADDLLALLEPPDPKEKDGRELGYQAARALGAMGPEVAPRLLRALETPAPRTREYVVSALRDLGLGIRQVKGVVPALLPLLKEKEGRVRSEAVRALTMVGTEAKAAVPALVELLREKEENPPDQERRRDSLKPDVILALYMIGPEAKAAVPALLDLLKGDLKENREVPIPVIAGIALWRIDGRTRETVPVLLEALKQKDARKFERMVPIFALFLIGPDGKEALPLLEEESGPAAGMTQLFKRRLEQPKLSPLTIVLDALKDKDLTVRESAMSVLFLFIPESEQLIPAVTALLKDEDAGVRRNAEDVLSFLQGKRRVRR